jgi:hypothetical protein
MFLYKWQVKILLGMLVWYKADIIVLSKCNLFLPWYSWKIVQLVLYSFISNTACTFRIQWIMDNTWQNLYHMLYQPDQPILARGLVIQILTCIVHFIFWRTRVMTNLHGWHDHLLKLKRITPDVFHILMHLNEMFQKGCNTGFSFSIHIGHSKS